MASPQMIERFMSRAGTQEIDELMKREKGLGDIKANSDTDGV
jgi:hypothetical protein